MLFINTGKIYFIVAKYFQFWARLVLVRWNPFIIAVVGSAGKTTTLHFLHKILKKQHSVKISKKANGIISIPLDILGIQQETFSPLEWIKIALIAPFKSLSNPKEDIYICEMDSDRFGEMEAHTELIKPDITCWVSAYPCHTENFPGTDNTEIFNNMMHDIGYSLEKTKRFILVNGDAKDLESQVKRSQVPVGSMSLENNPNAVVSLKEHSLSLSGTKITLAFNTEVLNKLKHTLSFNIVKNYPDTLTINLPLAVLSKVNAYGLGMAITIGLLFDISQEDIISTLHSWRLPPGRMSLFAGRKATTIIDSSYNASSVATIDALSALKQLGEGKTIAVLGDMRELGRLSKNEHEKVAQAVIKNKIRRVILVGPQMEQYVWPILLQNGYKENRTLFKTLNPQWAANLLTSEDFLRLGEVILVKGSQNTLFLEGIVEQLLVSKKDLKYLCRQENLWKNKRKKIYR
jgi:UDP-N-acetylmuramyl pentapeptide synthase